jgi:hypothetical protein
MKRVSLSQLFAAVALGALTGLLSSCSKVDHKTKVRGSAAAPVSTAAGTTSPVATHTGTSPVATATPLPPVVAPPPPPPPLAGAGGLSAPPAGALAPATTTITVGQGPVVGTTARGDVFEHLRDWEARDLRALDPLDVRLAGDGLTPSRELVAFYSRRQNGRLFLRVDLLDLRYGAELGGLDLVFLLGWSGAGSVQPPLGLREQTQVPYDAALVILDTQDRELLDRSGVAAVTSASPTLDVSFRADLDTVEVGLDLSELSALGWSGQPLTFQALTVRDGSGRVADAALEVGLLDRSLDEYVREDWVAARSAKLAPIVVGNRAALTAEYLRGLVHSTATTTSEGFATGLRRTLESHEAHGLPLNIHLSGVLANAIGWAASPDPRQDGAAFLDRVAEFFDGNAANGEGDFLPGLYVDNMLPYFKGAANQRFVTRAAEVYQERLGLTQAGPVFWTPERVIDGGSFDDLLTAGFSHTVIDRTHLEGWFGAQVQDGGLHRVNGVDCFVIDPTVNLFSSTDGGPSLKLRRLLIQRALDPNPEQVVVFVADWEEFAGRKGNPDVPDVYDRNLTWLSQRPWIQLAGLNDLATRGWSVNDHGMDPTLPTETYEWLRHANEENYDHWYYGHALEQSLSALRPEIRYGRPHARQIGDVATPGTLFGDVWAQVNAAPQGQLRDLAEVAFASGLYRTAWHREDMHDTRRLNNGAYVSPDVTFDMLSGFSFSLATHVGEAAITARAAGWAALPPGTPTVLTEDVDLDGEPEFLLMDDRMLLVFEADGGRIVAGFTRDASGEGYQVLGDPMAFPSRSTEIGYEDDFVGAARNSALKDIWLTGAGRGYVNDSSIAAISTTSQAAISFASSDGLLNKTVSWSGPGQVTVRYALDPSAGTLYLRAGLNPHLAALAISGQRDLVEQDTGGVYSLEKTYAGKTVSVRVGYADAGHTARRNAQASDGSAASPRNTAFQHMIELSGDAPGFEFSLGFSVR